MLLKPLMLVLATIVVGNSESFPLKLDQNCFVNFVYENNAYLEYPEQLKIPKLNQIFQNITAYTHSYTVHDVQNLNFSFDIDELDVEDNLSLTDGYFRFHSKYRVSCNIFLLLTTIFNETTTAITKSGHGTSGNTLFLVIPLPSQIENTLNEFPTQFRLLESETKDAFYASLAFISFQDSGTSIKMEVRVYCYYCPEPMGNLHLLKIESNIRISTISAECKRWNSNGYMRSVYVIFTLKIPEHRIAPLYTPIAAGRDGFYDSMRGHVVDHIFVYAIIIKELNMTIHSPVYQYAIENENEVYWHLSVKEISHLDFNLRNILAVTRAVYRFMDQGSFQVMYCMKSSDLVKISWDIYLRVLDFWTWFCIVIMILGYALLYRNLFKALDLIWIMFDMEFWLKHPRKILGFYVIGAVFLPWLYDSGMSTDFVNFENPTNFDQIFKMGHRLWVTELKHIRMSAQIAPNYTRQLLLRDVDVNRVQDFFSTMDEYKFPNIPMKQVKAMAMKKLLIPMGLKGAMSLPSLTHALSIKEPIVVEDDFVCGVLSVSSRYGFQLTAANEFRGQMLEHALRILSIFQQNGLFVHAKKHMLFLKSIQTKLKVQDLSTALSSTTLAVRTPLFAVCLAYIVMNVILLICNFLWWLYANRIKVTDKIVQGGKTNQDYLVALGTVEGKSYFANGMREMNLTHFNWTVSKSYCEEKGLKLAKIDTEAEAKFLKSVYDPVDFNGYFWVLGREGGNLETSQKQCTNYKPHHGSFGRSMCANKYFTLCESANSSTNSSFKPHPNNTESHEILDWNSVEEYEEEDFEEGINEEKLREDELKEIVVCTYEKGSYAVLIIIVGIVVFAILVCLIWKTKLWARIFTPTVYFSVKQYPSGNSGNRNYVSGTELVIRD
ncbi:unnamed protein product [Orchesella dallaii]|uniref:C-type lectin domain-containing protein n=1 Tax=Orchesella dallaii TaxID=48710 RepID=A0ABP1PPC8_9HEXA